MMKLILPIAVAAAFMVGCATQPNEQKTGGDTYQLQNDADSMDFKLNIGLPENFQQNGPIVQLDIATRGDHNVTNDASIQGSSASTGTQTGGNPTNTTDVDAPIDVAPMP